MAKDKVVNVPNVGPVAFPSSMGWDEIEKNVRLIAIQSGATDVAAPKRTWGEAATDIGLNLGQGIGSMLLKPIGTAAGFYPGADNFLTRSAEGLSYGQEKYQSDAQRLNQMAAQNRINQAEKESGQFMAGLQAVKEYVTNPILAGKFVTEQLPQFGMMAATGGASRALSGLAGLGEVAAGRAALGTAIGTGAAMNAADVSTSTYGAIMGLDARGLQEMQRDPDFRQYLAETGDIGKAQQLYAENHARKAGGAAFGITLATSAVPGAQSVERLLSGQVGKNLAAKEAEQLAKSGFVKGLGKGMLGEAGQEVAEEGGGQYLQNIYTPGAEAMAGVGQAAGLGALGGALFGGVSGGVEGAAQKAEYNRRQELLSQFKQDVSDAIKSTEKPPVADGILPPEIVPTVPSPVETQAVPEQPAVVPPAATPAVQAEQPETPELAPPAAPRQRPAGPVSIQTLAEEMAIAEKTGNFADMDRILEEYRKLKMAEPQDISTQPISEEEVMSQPAVNAEPVVTEEPTVSPSEKIFGASPAGTAVGWDTEGSKPFTTQKAAKAALDQAIEDGTLDKTYRPVAVSKGKFYLSPMTPAEIKEAQNADEEEKSKQFAKNKPVAAHEYIAGLGGVDPSMRSDTRIEGNIKSGKGWLFAGAKSGRGLTGDQLAEALYQGGYTPTELDGYEALEFVMRSAEGDPQYKLGQIGSAAEEEMRQRMADYNTRQQEAQEDQETPEEVAARKAAEEDDFFQAERNATEEEKKNADTVARGYVKGKVVWQDGRIALIRIFSDKNNLMYIAANHLGHTLKDIKDYTGNLFTKANKDKLLQARKDIEDADELKSKTDPFIKFDKNNFAASQNVPKTIKDIASEWKKMFKLNGNIYLTTIEDIDLNQDNFDGQYRKLIPTTEDKSNAGFCLQYKNGDTVIAFEKGKPTTKILETLSHEFGHLHQTQVFDKADTKTQNAIIDEYNNWLKTARNVNLTQAELVEILRARKTQKLMTYDGDENNLATKLNGYYTYWTDFNEWYADQTAKWATTTEKPLTVVQKFFKRLGDAMRSFYLKLRNQKYLPNETFKQYMDAVTADVNFIYETPVSPINQTAQLSLNFMRDLAKKTADTPAFKKWFGNSKVVDANGKPLVMYHGTRTEIEAPRTRGNRNAFFVTPDPNFANKYALNDLNWYPEQKGFDKVIEDAQVYPVYIRAINPFDYENSDHVLKIIPQFRKMLKEEGYNRDRIEDLIDGVREGKWTAIEWANDYDLFEKNGFDAFYAKEQGRKNLGVFESTQIKSAIGNNGEFSKTNPDIRYEIGRVSSNPVVAATQANTIQQVNQMTTAPTATKSASDWDNLVKDVTTFQEAAGKLRDFIKNAPLDQRTQLFKVLTMRQLADLGKSHLPGMKDYMDIVNEMAGDRDTRLFKAGEIADKWAEMRRKDPTNYVKCSDVMHESTIARFDPSKYKEGDKISAEEEKILNSYESLPNNWKNLYQEVRNYYAKRGLEYQQLISDRIDQAITDKKHALGIKLMLKQRFEQMMRQGPYFPLSRFGDYSAYFEINGEPHYYLFQFPSELKAFQQQNPDIKMQTGVKVKDLLGTKAGSGDTFVNEVFKQIDALSQRGLELDNRNAADELKDAIWQLNLLSKPEVSMSRNFIHRNGIKGYDNDALRSFADNTFHASYQMAKLKFQGNLQSKMNEMQRTVANMRSKSDPDAVKAGEYLNELSDRRDWIMNPADSNMLTEKASQFGFLYFLASPASALVNLSQNAVIAYPTLGARYGFGRTFEAMSSASKAFFQSGDRSKFMTHEGLFNITRSLKGNEKAAMERLIEIGTLTRTNTYDLVGLADKPSAEYGTAAQTANKWISGLFHSAEVFNRSTTALAAYRLEVGRLKAFRNKGTNNLTDKEIHEQAIKAANDMTIDSHFDYSAANKPPVMQGPTARIILMYKQYAQHVTYLLANSTRQYMSYLVNKYKGTPMEQEAIQTALEAKRKLTGILGMTALLGGMTAMPLWWVVSGVMNAIMGDPDEPYDFDQEFTATLAENLNPTLAKAIMHGSPELLQGAGIAAPDLSGRISLNGLWFRDDNKNVDREDATRNFIVQMGGPYAGLAVNIAAAVKLIEEGNTWRGMEKMLPSVIANGLKGIRYEFEGANTLRGDPLLGDVTNAEAALQALGFTPSRLARIYETNAAQKNFEKSVTDRRNLILHKMYLAMMNGDEDAYDNIGEMIIKFNESNPEYPITQDTIQRSIRGNQKKAAEAEHGVILNKKLSGKTRPMADILED